MVSFALATRTAAPRDVNAAFVNCFLSSSTRMTVNNRRPSRGSTKELNVFDISLTPRMCTPAFMTDTDVIGATVAIRRVWQHRAGPNLRGERDQDGGKFPAELRGNRQGIDWQNY